MVGDSLVLFVNIDGNGNWQSINNPGLDND